MYKYIGIGLLGLFAMTVIPFQETIVGTEYATYGIGAFVVHDAYGNEVMRHAIHNFVVDQGETFINNQVFVDGVEPTTTNEIGAICINGDVTAAEDMTAATLDAGTTIIGTSTRCHNVVLTTAGGSTQSAAEQFDTTDTGGAGKTITSIGVCQKGGTAEFQNCVDGAARVLLASVAVSVTLEAGETVDIDYTFNID